MGYKRNFQASPLFSFSNSSTLTAGSTWTVDCESDEPTSQKYLPFNYTVITNLSSAPLIFYPNQSSRGKFIPPNSFITFDKKTIPAISSFKIKNNSATTDAEASKIEVTLSKEQYDSQDLLTNVHKALFNFFGGLQ